jgi:hypothetical protein
MWLKKGRVKNPPLFIGAVEERGSQRLWRERRYNSRI